MKISKLIISNIALLIYFLSGVVLAQSNDSFLLPPEVIMLPEKTGIHSPAKRKFTGIPSVAISPEGRLWSTWYTGPNPHEDLNNYVVLSTSGDNGNTWQEVLVIDPDGPGEVRAYDPEIWIDPDGKLWVFWAQAAALGNGATVLIEEGTAAGVWAIKADNPELEDPNWGAPVRITDGVMMCKPLKLSTGEWTLPVSIWKKEPNNARMVVSTDKGVTWKVKGGASVPDDVRSFDENIIIERKDGSLWMLIRTKYGIGESISKDRGSSWSPVAPSVISHPSARFFLTRLKSENLLLVKHGPIDVKIARSHLMAFISKDDGKSWSSGLLIDQRNGVSYPDGQETEDGKIYIVYDYNRTTNQNIFITSFTEKDILTNDYDKSIIKIYNNRKIVSEGGKD